MSNPAGIAMVLAVLEQRCGLRLNDRDVYVSTVGGAKVSDPAADLAAAIAIASAACNRPAPHRIVALGEVGLAGELRRCAGNRAQAQRGSKARFRRGRRPS